jgi:hypothetical protein
MKRSHWSCSYKHSRLALYWITSCWSPSTSSWQCATVTCDSSTGKIPSCITTGYHACMIFTSFATSSSCLWASYSSRSRSSMFRVSKKKTTCSSRRKLSRKMQPLQVPTSWREWTARVIVMTRKPIAQAMRTHNHNPRSWVAQIATLVMDRRPWILLKNSLMTTQKNKTSSIFTRAPHCRSSLTTVPEHQKELVSPSSFWPS